MEAEPSPGPSLSSINFPFQQGDFSSFGDLFSRSHSQSLPPSNNSSNTYSQHPSPSAPSNALSPGQNFADLLAEFTLPGTALSPPRNGEDGNPEQSQVAGGGGGGYSNAPSPQQQQNGGGGGGGNDLSNEVNLQFQQFIAASLAGTSSAPTPTPQLQQQQQQQQQQQYTPQSLYQSHQSSPAGSHAHSLPSSHAPSPLPNYSSNPPPSNPMYQQQQPIHQAAPYVVIPNPYSVGPQQYSIPTSQAQLFAQQFAMLQSQGQQQMANVLAQAQAIVQANQIAQQQQQQHSVGSQSTSADGEWRENEFVFSPLMSPAMTPGSVFTAASSLPPSTGPLPMSAPSDFFPPLTSPALGPQMYSTDHQHLSHRNSLQGLVDGVGALSTQLPPPGSPHVFPYQSPRIHPHDAGSHTAAGSGRRGASSTNKKARPSPLIKATDPTIDPNRRKRRATASNGNGNKSATTSPYIPATNPSSNGSSSKNGTFSAGSSTGGLSQKTSPAEFQNGIDTPSPVDLASSTFSNSSRGGSIALEGLPIPPPAFSNSSHSQQQSYQLEPMGPPPPPSHSSAQHHSATANPQHLSTSASSSHSSSFNPITPAAIMNFSSDFDISTLSSLSPALGPTADENAHPGSAYASLQSSPILLPRVDSSSTPIVNNVSHSRGEEEESIGASTVSSIGKAKSSRKSNGGGSVKASPALRAVDAKGKGKVEGGRKNSTKQAKIAPSSKNAPSPKIKASIPVDSLPEPHSRFAGKINYEELPAAPPTAENRKSTHKLAEQKRRDSLKLCFDELRKLLPPIMPFVDDGNRRPGEGNVGGQRNGELDPENPNKGVSKVALLRRSNEYLEILRERIERRDRAISALRRQNEELKLRQKEMGGVLHEGNEGEGEPEEEEEDELEIPGLDLDLDNIDGGERAAGNLAFYEDLDFETKFASLPTVRRSSTSSTRRASVNSASTSRPTRRSTRNSSSQSASNSNEAMEVEG